MSELTLEEGGKVKKAARYFSYSRKRHLFFFLATFMLLGLPFVYIGEHRLFLLSFLHKRLELFGLVFSASELYVLPLIIFIFAGWVLLWTSLGGRIWCGWGCPQTIMRAVYRDFLQGFVLRLRNIKNKNKPLALESLSAKLRYGLGLVIWFCLCLLITANLSWYFIDPPEWLMIIQGPVAANPFVFFFWLGLATLVFIDIVVVQENFCKYICPYARIQSVFFDKDTALVTYLAHRGDNKDGSRGMRNFQGELDKTGDCTNCLACVKVCPTGIDIRNGLQLGCIECLECVDACQPVMARKNVPNLIAWTTQAQIEGGRFRFLRPRTILYGVFILAAVSALFVLSGTQGNMTVKINHAANTFLMNDQDQRVENGYQLLFTNSASQQRNFTFGLRSPYPLEIVLPKTPITVPENGIIKKSVLLGLNYQDLKQVEDAQFPFEIEIYEDTDPTKVVRTIRGTFFIPEK